MTVVPKTVTKHIEEAQAILAGKELLTRVELATVEACLELALSALQYARCKALGGIDEL